MKNLVKEKKEKIRHLPRFVRSEEEISADKKLRNEAYLGYFDMSKLPTLLNVNTK